MMLTTSSLHMLPILPIVVVTIVLICVKANVITSVNNQIVEYLTCRVMTKVSDKRKSRILKITEEYNASVIELGVNMAKYTAAAEVVVFLKQTAPIVLLIIGNLLFFEVI